MLKGKVALVTGGSRGIGSSICLELARAGARVIINYSSSLEGANKVLEDIKSIGGEAEIVKFDVSDTEVVEKEIKILLDNHERIDILVNNAGITRDSLFMRMKEDQWDQVFDINAKGVFNCTKNIVRSMVKNKYGKIINITSVVGEMGNAGQVNYSSTKSAIMGFTKSLAKELGSKNINVNAVSPGFIETEITDVLPDNIKEQYKEKIPLSRFGQPEDIAKAVLFLASDDSSYITGEVLKINGGLYT
ncbi:MAG: 3-oxoacyl-[acyl-carrier-protein] reductase [Thermodesulfobacteriota bacterium]|jgi:3-oxoacyl-[acyl-carrier protein] reductase|nr:3-oxoacyl-[acyl-carrier-protein] reductase [bacterium]MBT3849903.1 3-oxoacyl-[acyl-carrier-protein] reductase [bacterium]MBT4435084.1 3-oxoacyl-[acyl-carrier-protein] reductase [bacterium]MDG2445853.1 3-oxoacyl-[acyl-carrier-protein] reductase [Thermodesulfobacteriota bacterium]RZP13467.1 MAG: 3-oxoacyl-[acyl-carrier-protein] reductase [Candidatus Dadabacteria bacterium]|tara:strand:- start:4791 stop:5531 length:741 start_codon:yes stop_codon:yes gene_type:complete